MHIYVISITTTLLTSGAVGLLPHMSKPHITPIINGQWKTS